jgi:hypothetical protein
MATRLDQQIEQLEIIVEKCLDLCNVTCNELRCTLPAQHEPTKLRKFRRDSPPTPSTQGEIGLFADRVSRNNSR